MFNNSRFFSHSTRPYLHFSTLVDYGARRMIHIELQLIANAVLLFLLLDRSSRWRQIRRQMVASLPSGRRSVTLVGALALALAAALGLTMRIPVPAIHDEFAYLLTAETFKLGRLTNPTHPMWEFFESPHIFHVPSYQAKYPPGQGLSLALGWQLFGHPIVGVWIVYSLACAAVCWMLRAYVSSRWAMIGGLICLFNACMTLGRVRSYTTASGLIGSHGWGQTYWGGGVAMLGGALLFGAMPRLLMRPTILHGLILGLGLAILANSRPYEGLVCALPVGAVFFWAMWTKMSRREWGNLARMTCPVLLVLLVTFVGMLIYNKQVTGEPFKMPYQVWKEQYSGPSMLSSLLPAGVARNENIARKLLWEWEFFVRVLLSVPLLFSLFCWVRDPWVLLAGVCSMLTLDVVLLQNTAGHPHYLAPVVAPFTLLIVAGLRQLYSIRLQHLRIGRAFVNATLLVYVISFACTLWTDGIREPMKARYLWSLDRQHFEERLREAGRQHLVIVNYGTGHSWHQEWVYNQADIDGSPVVWAHDLGEEKNAELLDYFADRQCWMVEVNRDHGPLRRVDR